MYSLVRLLDAGWCTYSDLIDGGNLTSQDVMDAQTLLDLKANLDSQVVENGRSRQA